MKKIILFFLFLSVTAFSYGCSHKDDDIPEFENHVTDEGKTAENLQNMEIEEYIDEEDPENSPYVYMQKIRLRDENYTVDTYIIKSDNIKIDGASAESSSDGVTMKTSLVKNGNDVIRTNTEKRLERINRLENLKEEPRTEIRDNIGIISYSVVKGNKEYPCLYICKADNVVDEDDMKIILFTEITINNMKANERTADIMKEVMEVTGIEQG